MQSPASQNSKASPTARRVFEGGSKRVAHQIEVLVDAGLVSHFQKIISPVESEKIFSRLLGYVGVCAIRKLYISVYDDEIRRDFRFSERKNICQSRFSRIEIEKEERHCC